MLCVKENSRYKLKVEGVFNGDTTPLTVRLLTRVWHSLSVLLLFRNDSDIRILAIVAVFHTRIKIVSFIEIVSIAERRVILENKLVLNHNCITSCVMALKSTQSVLQF